MTLRKADKKSLKAILKKYDSVCSIPFSFDISPGRVYTREGTPGREYNNLAEIYRAQHVDRVIPIDNIFSPGYDKYEDLVRDGEDSFSALEASYLIPDNLYISSEGPYDDIVAVHPSPTDIITKEGYTSWFLDTFSDILRHNIRRWKSSRDLNHITAKRDRDYICVFEDDTVSINLSKTNKGHIKNLPRTACVTADQKTKWVYDNMTTKWGVTFFTITFKKVKNIKYRKCVCMQALIDNLPTRKPVPVRIYSDNIGEPITCKDVLDINYNIIERNPRDEYMSYVLDSEEIYDIISSHESLKSLSC